MSFFGFDPSLPPDRTHNTRAPGFSHVDPFAGLSRRNDGDEEEEGLDFEDAYDGLGDRLEEDRDALNDATFGSGPVGKDFDFSGMGGMPGKSQSQSQEPVSFAKAPSRPSPPRTAAKPFKTGYETYKTKATSSDFAPSASIWGMQPTAPEPKPQAQHVQQPSLAAATRKMMSLDEVEAMMRSQPKKPPPSVSPQPPQQLPPTDVPLRQIQQQPQILQRPMQMQPPAQQPFPAADENEFRSYPQPRMPPQGPAIHARNQSQGLQQVQSPPVQIPQILQNPNRMPQAGHERQPSAPRGLLSHHRGPSLGGRPVTHPDQITALSEEERAAFLLEEANRAKRNHKIHLLSKDNGLMTPQDKNFITRIQLQQLVTATGGVDEQGPEAALAEDFYYQVYNQIRGSRPDPSEPTGQFAQTYLNQLAWRGGSRRFPRGGENHMRRMEQQVQRAVEAAKARPKNKQLVVEGSLGKISFSNAKTPKPLLNLKRNDSSDGTHAASRPRPQENVAGRKAVLRDIEAVYSSLMKMEDHERRMPPPPREESSADEIQGYMDWRQRIQDLNRQLWNDLKVLEPIDSNSTEPHPFIAILSHPKGKKLIPRVFRQIDDQQRVTILTMIVVQLDMLDVIRFAQPIRGQELPLGIRHAVDLFAQAVEPSLFAYIGDAALGIVIGLVGLITERVNINMTVQAKTGVNLLTRLISRAVLIKQSGHTDDADWNQWTSSYNKLFDLIEPQLGLVFPSPVTFAEDFHVWQFLAALGIGASPEQQQRLVIAVKDRVMETVGYAKSLPEDVGKPRLDNVNLFMHAIGLDVDLLG